MLNFTRCKPTFVIPLPMKKLFTLLFCMVASWASAQTPVTIQQIHNPILAPGDSSSFQGDLVIVKGVVLTQPSQYYQHPGGPCSGTSTTLSFWIADTTGGQATDNSGLQVILFDETSGTATDVNGLVAGDYVELTGNVSYFNGRMQLSLEDNGVVNVLASGVALPQPMTITVDQLNDAAGVAQATGALKEGTYVQIVNIGVSATVNETNSCRGRFSVSGNSSAITIWDGFQFMRQRTYPGAQASPNRAVAVGTQYDTIRGLVIHNAFNGSPQAFEIWPFRASDLVIGDAPPVVNSLMRGSVCPNDGQVVTITAEVESADPGNPVLDVDAVELYWGTGTTPTYTMVAMTNTGGSTYTADIPAQANGTLVSYYIVARETDLTNPLAATYPSFGPECYTVNNGGCAISDIQRVPQIRFTGSQYWQSGYAGYTVTDVKGVVTAVFNEGSSATGYRVVIQEPGQTAWAGIELVGDPGIHTLNVGDSVNITNATVQDGGSPAFGTTRLNVTSFNDLGPANTTIVPVAMDINNFFNTDTMSYLLERYEAMLVGFSGALRVVNLEVDQNALWRVGTDALDPNQGVVIVTGRKTNSVFSSLNVSYVNNASWATTDGTIMATPVCVVEYDNTTMDGVQGILTYSFNKVVLNPRDNDDFTNIDNTSCTVGIEDGELAQGVTLYPNPTTGRLAVAFGTAPRGQYTATVLDLTGRTVASQNLEFQGNQAEVNLGNLQNGTYLVVLQGTDGARHTQRVVVLH